MSLLTRITSRKKFKELWKRVQNVEKNGIIYKVSKEIYISNTGKVKRIYDDGTESVTTGSNQSGYRVVSIMCIDSHGKPIKIQIRIHRLVADAFLDKVESKNISNHLNGHKHHNWSWNLEWTDVSGNTRHAYDNKLAKPLYGEQSKHAKLDNAIVLEIARMLIAGYSNLQIMNEINALGYDCGVQIISDIRNKRRWTHLVENFNFPESPPHRTKKLQSDELVHEICKLILNNLKDSKIAKRIDTATFQSTSNTRSYIRQIRNKRVRTDISDQYFKDPYVL